MQRRVARTSRGTAPLWWQLNPAARQVQHACTSSLKVRFYLTVSKASTEIQYRPISACSVPRYQTATSAALAIELMDGRCSSGAKLPWTPHLPRQPKVAELELATVGVQDVGGLQVAVDDPVFVQVCHAAARRAGGGGLIAS